MKWIQKYQQPTDEMIILTPALGKADIETLQKMGPGKIQIMPSAPSLPDPETVPLAYALNVLTAHGMNITNVAHYLDAHGGEMPVFRLEIEYLVDKKYAKSLIGSLAAWVVSFGKEI